MDKIKDLSFGQGNVNINGVIKELGETRSINKFKMNE